MHIAIDIVKFIVLIIVTFYFSQIITNKNKRISIIGTFLIVCSTAVVQYIDNGFLEVLISGELFLICIDKIFGKTEHKALPIFGIFASVLIYLIFSNLSFQFSMLFAFIPILIWILLKNRKEINLRKKQIIFFVFALILGALISTIFYRYNVIQALENENGLSYLMSYTYSFNIPFNKTIKFSDNSALATCMSIFPMVLLVAVIYVFKYEKHSEFLIPTSIFSILGIIGISGVNAIFGGIVPNYIMALSISILQIYMMIYIFANVEEKVFSLKASMYVSLAGIIAFLLIKFPTPFTTIRGKTRPYMIFVLESFIFLNYSDKRFWRVATVVYPIIVLIESIGFLVMKII